MPQLNDLHIVRFFSSFVTVKNGKAVKATEPYLKYCPLASFLYRHLKLAENYNQKITKEMIIKGIQDKISKFGFFTENRNLSIENISIPYKLVS